MLVLALIQGSQTVILAAVAGIILLIIIGGIIKSGGKGGCGWIISLIIAAIIGYLLISAEIIKIP